MRNYMQIFQPNVPIVSLISLIMGDVQMANVKNCSSFCFRSNRPGKDKLDGLVNTFKGWLVTKGLSPLRRGAKGWMEKWKAWKITRMSEPGGYVACEQALQFGLAKWASRERASEAPRAFPLPLAASPLAHEGNSLTRSRETRFTRPNRRACSQTRGYESIRFPYP